jgi:hypothetical protein
MSTFAIEPPRLPLAVRPCKGCGRPIYWVTTQAGKRTPLDRYVDHGSDPSGRYVLVESDETHWSSCPAREQFARRSAGSEA